MKQIDSTQNQFTNSELEQIEEMAKDICDYARGEICILDDKKCDMQCTSAEIAKKLTAKGYRKQSEVAEEIFAEIEKFTYRYLNDADYSGGDLIYDLAELKKKYTEGELQWDAKQTNSKRQGRFLNKLKSLINS